MLRFVGEWQDRKLSVIPKNVQFVGGNLMDDHIEAIQIEDNRLYRFFDPSTDQYIVRYPKPEEVGGFLVIRSYLYDLQCGMQMFNSQ
jgi:hypothetical protein